MSVSTVWITAPCPSCGVILNWQGVVTSEGGTRYVINCRPCGPAPRPPRDKEKTA